MVLKNGRTHVTDERYGTLIGITWALIPGLVGLWGIIAGLIQGRPGPIAVGVIFLILAGIVFKTMYMLVVRKEKENKP